MAVQYLVHSLIDSRSVFILFSIFTSTVVVHYIGEAVLNCELTFLLYVKFTGR